MHTNNVRAKKPYPWKCTNCGELAIYGATVDHSKMVDYDGQKYLIKIDGLKAARCVKCGRVMLDSEAHEILQDEFIRQLKILLPAEIREHRLKANLTQQQLAAATGISVELMARLEDGDQFQNRTVDNLLRLLLGLTQPKDMLAAPQIGALPALMAPTVETAR